MSTKESEVSDWYALPEGEWSTVEEQVREQVRDQVWDHVWEQLVEERRSG